MNSRIRLTAGIILAGLCLLLLGSFMLKGRNSSENLVPDKTSEQIQTAPSTETAASTVTRTEPTEILSVMDAEKEDILPPVHENEFHNEPDIQINSEVLKPAEADTEPVSDIVTGPWIDIDY